MSRKQKFRASRPTLGIAFRSPEVYMTRGAQMAFTRTGENPAKFLDRHFSGDFGDLSEDDRKRNEEELVQGGMILSVYHLQDATKMYIITDPGHERTTILLPEEY